MNEFADNQNCLSDNELSALADSAFPEHAAASMHGHLRDCERCRSRFEKIRSLGAAGKTQASMTYQPTCPSPEHFGAYLEHTLSQAELREMDEHLCKCSWCRGLLLEFNRKGLRASPDPEILSLVSGLVAAPEETTAPPAIRERRHAGTGGTGFSWFLAGASLTAAAAFAAIFMILGFGNSPQGGTHPSAADKAASPHQRHAFAGLDRGPTLPPAVTADQPWPKPDPDRNSGGSDTTETELDAVPATPSPAIDSGGASREEHYNSPFPEQLPPEEPQETVVLPGPEERPDHTASSPGFEITKFQPRFLNSDAYGDLGSGLALVTGTTLDLPRDGAAPVAVSIGDDSLTIDADGDGIPETVVNRRKPVVAIRVSHKGGAKGRYFARFSQEGGRWYYRSSHCMAGRIASQPLFLFDENGNGRFDDAGIDRIAYGTADNFTYVSPVMLIAGVLYEVRVSGSGERVEHRRYEGPAGSVDMTSGFRGRARVATAVITDGSTWLNVGAGQGACQVPPGHWRLACGVISGQKFSAVFDGPAEAAIEVSAGAEVIPEWGGPLVIDFSYESAPSEISLSTSDVHFVGILGERYYHPNAQIARTKVTVRDPGTLRILADPVLSVPVTGARFVPGAPGG